MPPSDPPCPLARRRKCPEHTLDLVLLEAAKETRHGPAGMTHPHLRLVRLRRELDKHHKQQTWQTLNSAPGATNGL